MPHDIPPKKYWKNACVHIHIVSDDLSSGLSEAGCLDNGPCQKRAYSFKASPQV